VALRPEEISGLLNRLYFCVPCIDRVGNDPEALATLLALDFDDRLCERKA
jgi:hypothetical protein